MTERPPVRYEDYTLDPTQEELRDAVRRFLTKRCDSTVVRASSATGFDADLWDGFEQIADSIVTEDGDGAGLVELALIAEEVGRVAAPIPFVSTTVARRLLASGKTKWPSGPLALAPEPADPGKPQLVPDAAIAAGVVALTGNALRLHAPSGVRAVANQGCTPLGWWETTSDHVAILEGPEALLRYERARTEWKLLTAAALVGLTSTALAQATTFAKERKTLGVPIGALQGVAFPLADLATSVASARHLVWRAAWFTDNEPNAHPDLPLMAWAYAWRTAVEGTRTAAHFHGGLGFSLESDVTLYFLRAAGWGTVAGSPHRDLISIGRSAVSTR